MWDAPTFASRLDACDRNRWITLAWGAALAAMGARRRGFAGGLLATFGGIVAIRAAMGHHDGAVVRGWIDQRLKAAGWRRADVVNDTSEDSFPASDAPQWTEASATTKRG
ncbi:MAG TPA: hypothetical protein VD833_02675 [Vicinamibacterales bacterium]|nr:hypothetical protein [Vicinamibacterales bacterium]